jgi:hypothetical protein
LINEILESVNATSDKDFETLPDLYQPENNPFKKYSDHFKFSDQDWMSINCLNTDFFTKLLMDTYLPEDTGQKGRKFADLIILIYNMSCHIYSTWLKGGPLLVALVLKVLF